MISVFHKVDNNVGKGENAGYQHFLLSFPTMFSKNFFSQSLKVGIVSQRVLSSATAFNFDKSKILPYEIYSVKRELSAKSIDPGQP